MRWMLRNCIGGVIALAIIGLFWLIGWGVLHLSMAGSQQMPTGAPTVILLSAFLCIPGVLLLAAFVSVMQRALTAYLHPDLYRALNTSTPTAQSRTRHAEQP
jgi:hypothetical protein